MTILTDAPHWSLWALDKRMATLELPEEPSQPLGAWRGRWLVCETVSAQTRTQITGHLDIEHIPNGDQVQLDFSQVTPGVQGMSVKVETTLTCERNEILTPQRWVCECISHSGRAVLEETRASQEGRIHRGKLKLSGLDESTTALPKDRPLTSSVSLMAALPRLNASGAESMEFTLLEELLVVRPRQVLERIQAVDLKTASGTSRLQGFRHYGTGTPPIHYWLGSSGLPLVIGTLGTLLVSQSFEDLEGGI